MTPTPPVVPEGTDETIRKAREKLDILDLLVSAGYDAEAVHPLCYKKFSHVKFTEAIIAATRAPQSGAAPLEALTPSIDLLVAIDEVISRITEWDDRTSPEDLPDGLLITGDELRRELLRFADGLSLSPPAAVREHTDIDKMVLRSELREIEADLRLYIDGLKSGDELRAVLEFTADRAKRALSLPITRGGEAREAAETLLKRADSVIHTDVIGQRFRKVFAADLDALALALSRAEPAATPLTVCSLCLGTGKVFHENPPGKTHLIRSATARYRWFRARSREVRRD